MTTAAELLPGDWPSKAVTAPLGDIPIIDSFGQPQAEYAAAKSGAALIIRDDRALLTASGGDRAPWLHNLVTNQVKSLSTGDGHYAFCLNVQGRILFDLHYWLRPNEIWIDLDRRWKEKALNHFDKYIIMEDVTLADITGDWTPVALIGPKTSEILAAAGIPNASTLAYQQIQAANVFDVPCIVVRGQLGAIPSFRLNIPQQHAARVISALIQGHAVQPVGRAALDALRIEVGYVWPISEINEDVLPAETGQLKHAVSFQKGCYLGQEVVERMNARKVVARRLMLIEPDKVTGDLTGAKILAGDSNAHNEQEIGQVTSASGLSRHGQGLALGFVKTRHAIDGRRIRIPSNAADLNGVLKSLPEFEDHPT